jgi:hypothetical protein
MKNKRDAARGRVSSCLKRRRRWEEGGICHINNTLHIHTHEHTHTHLVKKGIINSSIILSFPCHLLCECCKKKSKTRGEARKRVDFHSILFPLSNFSPSLSRCVFLLHYPEHRRSYIALYESFHKEEKSVQRMCVPKIFENVTGRRRDEHIRTDSTEILNKLQY